MGSPSENNKTQKRRKRKSKSICLGFPSEDYYHNCMEDREQCRNYLMEMIKQYPELFPEAIEEGFIFQGFLHSKKQDLTMRRIELKSDGEQYQLRPSFMMPYMVGRTDQPTR